MLRFAGYLVERALIRITSDPSVDLVLYVVADNPIGESTHYPDSNKWIVRSPERKIVRTANQDYYEGEE